MNELTIFIFDAEEGMELSRDVILNDGSVLLTKGTVLNLDLISRISGHHILEISVYDKTEADSAIDKYCKFVHQLNPLIWLEYQ